MLSLPVGSMHAMRPAFPPIFVYQTLAAEVYTSFCCDTQMSAFSDIAHTCSWLIMQFPFQWRCEAKPGLISKSLLCILLILIGIFQKLKKSELILNQPALQFALDSTVGNLKYFENICKVGNSKYLENIWQNWQWYIWWFATKMFMAIFCPPGWHIWTWMKLWNSVDKCSSWHSLSPLKQGRKRLTQSARTKLGRRKAYPPSGGMPGEGKHFCKRSKAQRLILPGHSTFSHHQLTHLGVARWCLWEENPLHLPSPNWMVLALLLLHLDLLPLNLDHLHHSIQPQELLSVTTAAWSIGVLTTKPTSANSSVVTTTATSSCLVKGLSGRLSPKVAKRKAGLLAVSAATAWSYLVAPWTRI